MTKEEYILNTTNNYKEYLKDQIKSNPKAKVTVMQEWLVEQFALAFHLGIKTGVNHCLETTQQFDENPDSLEFVLQDIVEDLEQIDLDLAARINYALIDKVS